MPPSILTNFQETTRGLLGNISSTFRPRNSSHHHSPSSSPTKALGRHHDNSSRTNFHPSTDSADSFLPLRLDTTVPQHQHTGSWPYSPTTDPTSPSVLSINETLDAEMSPTRKRSESGFSFGFKSRNSSSTSLFTNLSASFKQSHSKGTHRRAKDLQQPQQQPSPPPSPPALSPIYQESNLQQYQAQPHPYQPHPYQPHPYQPLQNPPQIPIVPPRREPKATTRPVSKTRQASTPSHSPSSSIGSDIFTPSSYGESTGFQPVIPQRSSSTARKNSSATASSPRFAVAITPAAAAAATAAIYTPASYNYHLARAEPGPTEAEMEEARLLEAQIEAEAAAAALAEDDEDQVQEYERLEEGDAEAVAMYPTVYQAANVTFNPIDDDDDEEDDHDDVDEGEDGTLPSVVEIHSLPEFFPNDDFGRNAKRYETYARQRLVALREHQQVLVELLKGLLGPDNSPRQGQHLALNDNYYGSHPGTEIAVIGEHIQSSMSDCDCDCPRRRSLRLQRQEEAVRSFQKAILDLWQADQNLCYWLSRYIRTTRRIGKSLGFILESLVDTSGVLTTAIMATAAAEEKLETETATEMTTTTTTTTMTTTMTQSTGGVSRTELVRMGILQSHLLDYMTIPSTHDYSIESSTLPPVMVAEDLSRRNTAPVTPSRLSSAVSSDSMEIISDEEDNSLVRRASMPETTTAMAAARSLPLLRLEDASDNSAKVAAMINAMTTTMTMTTTTSTTITTMTLRSTPAPIATTAPLPDLPPHSPFLPASSTTPTPALPAPSSPVPHLSVSSPTCTSSLSHAQQPPQQQIQPQYQQELITALISRPNGYFQEFDELEAAVFMGSHMQSLQKANEFLLQFNNESLRSRTTLERFKVAKAVYDHHVLGQPWKAAATRSRHAM